MCTSKRLRPGGVILTADNLLVTLVSGSIKVIIKVSNIELSNTTFASQIEEFFESTTNDPVSAQAIADESITILQDILSGTANVPDAITTGIQNADSSLYISLNAYFSSPEFIAALESSTVENVTMIISADGEAASFTISQGGHGRDWQGNQDSSPYGREYVHGWTEAGRYQEGSVQQKCGRQRTRIHRVPGASVGASTRARRRAETGLLIPSAPKIPKIPIGAW